MRSLSNPTRYWTSLTQGGSMGILLLMPKCSLCLFAVTNTITVCGLKPVIPPLWEYLLIGLFAVIQLALIGYEMRQGWKTLPVLLTIAGLAALVGFLGLDLASLYYYLGVALLSLAWFLLKFQRAKACKGSCTPSPSNHTI